jgi:hypothetical protein
MATMVLVHGGGGGSWIWRMGWPVYRIDSDHGLVVTHPEETAGLLDQIAIGRT